MSSGTGADISPEEANDLLHRLITESIKVQASFASGAKVTASVIGFLKLAPDGTVWVVERPDEVGTPHLGFDPSLARTRKYGDNRAFPGPSPELIERGAPRLVAALVFVLMDGSQVGLYEIAQQ